MTTTITREQAEQVLKIVEKQFAAYLDEVTDPRDRPQLVEGYEGADWGIVWESNSPYEWALNFGDEFVDQELLNLTRAEGVSWAEARKLATTSAANLPAGIRTEAYYSFTLCLYKD